MVRVKICGITRPEDALLVESAGADAIGLIFAASKRRVDSVAAAEIIAAVGPFITVVGVFRNAPLAQVIDTLTGLDIAVPSRPREDAPRARYTERCSLLCPSHEDCR